MVPWTAALPLSLGWAHPFWCSHLPTLWEAARLLWEAPGATPWDPDRTSQFPTSQLFCWLCTAVGSPACCVTFCMLGNTSDDMMDIPPLNPAQAHARKAHDRFLVPSCKTGWNIAPFNQSPGQTIQPVLRFINSPRYYKGHFKHRVLWLDLKSYRQSSGAQTVS